MVRSVLVPSINYPELRTIDGEDKGKEASLYEVELPTGEAIIALGHERYSFIDKGIVYFPFYLVEDNSVGDQIGVYEVFADVLPNLIDEEGDVELEKMGSPLIYSFVAKAIDASETDAKAIDASETDASETDASETDAKAIDASETDAEELVDEQIMQSQLEHTKDISEEENKEYEDKEDNDWVSKLLRNNNIAIVDNEGGGDCLFAAVRDGLDSVDAGISVEEMRAIIAGEASEAIFDTYKEHYDMYASSVREATKEMSRLARESTRIKSELKRTRDLHEKQELIEKAAKAAAEYSEHKIQKQMMSELAQEFSFMRGVKNIDLFKKKIQTCSFWADTWAISTLERVLDIKLVLLSEEAYTSGDLDNVLHCGQLNDDILEEKGSFTPKWYIMLAYDGMHYQIVTFKGVGAFKFRQLPYEVKEMIDNKCLEQMAGPYAIIPEVMEYKLSKNKDIADKETDKEEEGDDEVKLEVIESDKDKDVEEEVDVSDSEKPITLTPKVEDIFQFYEKSSARPLPGKGQGENADPSKYGALAANKNWRRMLSDSYPHSINIDNKQWPSVEHYVLSRYFQHEPTVLEEFTESSRSNVSKDILRARAMIQNGKFKGERILAPEIKAIQPANTNENRQKALENKFKNEQMRSVLKNTGDASLRQYIKGKPAKEDTLLMAIRDNITS